MSRSDDPGAAAPAGLQERRRRRAGLIAGIAITLVAIGVAVAFALPEGHAPGALVREVAELHELPREELPPDPLPDADAPGDTFSDIPARAGWAPLRARPDRVLGRATTTTGWGRGGRLIGHTLLPGPPAPPPSDARRTGRRGVLLHSFDVGPRTVVSWRQDGGTAVISAIGVPRSELYDLAGGPATP